MEKNGLDMKLCSSLRMELKTPLPASSNIGVETLTTERSRWSADGNKELTGVSDRKHRAARLGTPARCASHWEAVAKA